MHRCRILYLVFTVSITFGCHFVFSQPTLSYRKVITSLSQPVEIVSAPDGSNRLFVVQKLGLIKVYDKSFNFLGDFISVPGITTNGERGLLSLAFHPDYKNNGLFFVYYTNLQGDVEVSRYKVSSNANKADTTTRTIIITIPHRAAGNHNGGKLNFGPGGYLYFATGDGGGGGDLPNNAQNGKVLLGKMLRIDINNTTLPLNYSIPPDNPFVSDTTIADEIWALGLRNPFRWSFDRLTHDMWIGDVGQNKWEEINFRKAGETKGINYGWRCYEGKATYNTAGCKPADQYVSPIFDYPHIQATGGFAVTGGYVYRGSEYPSLNGYYIFADYVSGNQWMVSDSGNTKVVKQQTGGFPRSIAAFGEGEDGSLYVCSLTEGAVYKMEATTSVQISILEFAGKRIFSNVAQLGWRSTEQNILQYEIEGSIDSISFTREQIVPAKNQATENIYQLALSMRGAQKKFYRLRIVNKDGKWDYSKTIAVNNNPTWISFIFPNVIRTRLMTTYISDAYDNLLIYTINGKLMMHKSVRGFKGRVDIPVANLPKGMYLVKIANKNGYMTQWILVE